MGVDATLLESRSPLASGCVRSGTRFAQPVSTLSFYNQTFVNLIYSLRLSGPHPAPYNDSIASSGLRPISTINSAMCWMTKSINDACRTFEVTIWRDLLTVWTRYAVVFHLYAPRSNYHRLLVVSIRPVQVSGNVYANFEIYVIQG